MDHCAKIDAHAGMNPVFVKRFLLQGSHLVELSIDGLLNNPGSTVSDVCLWGDSEGQQEEGGSRCV